MHSGTSDSKIKFAENILSEIKLGLINSSSELELRRFFWSKSLGLDKMPSFPFVLSHEKNPSKKVLSLLSIKPTRSLSGVQVVAVMLPPFPCPGKCTYCPSSLDGKVSPKSYTGFEPSALRAQRLNFDAKKIVENRIKQLDATGNKAEKIELIFQGSSFTALPSKKQDSVVCAALNGVSGEKTSSLKKALLFAEKSPRRVVGITFETRPDLCSKSDITKMVSLGGTRVELGVQIPDDSVYKKISRGHSVDDVSLSTARLKDSAFKVLYHLMPGLPGSDYKNDLKKFKMIFSDERFKPDMIKFYPCLVIKGTKLYEDWKKGNFFPLEEEKAVKLLAELKSSLPKWVRVMRVERDIPGNLIEAGIRSTNLRQLVEKELHTQGKKCNCIRCREVGLNSRDHKFDFEKEFGCARMSSEFYSASGGEEAFISMESKNNLFGFVRLRKPAQPFLDEIDSKTALVRELHVYGKGLPLGSRSIESFQHQGIGKQLMLEAQRIAKEKFDSKRMIVISGVGVKEYYKKQLGYRKVGPFMGKEI